MIEDKDIERLKEIFVLKNDCNYSNDQLDDKLTAESLKLAVIETKLNQITWCLTAVAGGVISMLVKLFFD